ncbi:MAG: undecaprenyl diphosphate synthase family protein [Actinobacteria bacterium]|nr:undecaprenyl diphosphate synthase family protein [Actinomycetota bacterium]
MNARNPDPTPQLHHLVVVGGTLRDWADWTDEQWSHRISELGKVADHVGANWLVIRPFAGPPDEKTPTPPARTTTVGACVVTALAECDGRRRFARAVADLQAAATPITDRAIDALLNAPADVDPDLVVIVGAGHRTPPSLMWELAYSELVYIDADWRHFGAAHLDEAIGAYASRHRRFGGID